MRMPNVYYLLNSEKLKEEIMKLQTYKLSENAEELMVERDEVLEIIKEMENEDGTSKI
jgi:plasmid maintenance system antidote protein VapI